MRGEKEVSQIRTSEVKGSSPHARGKVNKQVILRKFIRIIPACAGKRKRNLPSRKRGQDHPRMRGEKCKLFIPLTDFLGSSPHARGKVQL